MRINKAASTLPAANIFQLIFYNKDNSFIDPLSLTCSPSLSQTVITNKRRLTTYFWNKAKHDLLTDMHLDAR